MADDVYGPIDFVLLEFEADNLRGEAAEALLDLVDRGIVRIFDLLIIKKDADGTFSGLAVDALADDEAGAFAAVQGASSGMLGDEDVAEAAGAMEPGTVAALIVFENVWAIPFVRAVYNAGGALIASARIPADVVNEALNALDAAN